LSDVEAASEGYNKGRQRKVLFCDNLSRKCNCVSLKLYLTPVDGVAWDLAYLDLPVSWERWSTCHEVECHWVRVPYSCIDVH
jgi:hypothetical protein